MKMNVAVGDGPAGYLPGPFHARALAETERQIQAEEEARQSAREAFSYACQTKAGEILAEQMGRRLLADAAARKAAAGVQREREARLAREQDYRAQLLAEGRRPRTISEILSDFARFT